MRRFMIAAVLLAAACREAPKPPPPPADSTADSVDVSMQKLAVGDIQATGIIAGALTSADTAQYGLWFVVKKGLPTTDSVRVIFRRDTNFANTALSQTKWSIKSRDTLLFKTPKVYDKKAQYSGCFAVKHLGVVRASTCKSWITNFVTPADTTPPVIDSVGVDSSAVVVALLVRPLPPNGATIDTFPRKADLLAKGIWSLDTLGVARDSLGRSLGFSCPAGGSRCPQRQYCTFFKFHDGKIGMRAMDAAGCGSEYLRFASTARVLSAKQQAVTDSRCIIWTVANTGRSNGTVTSELCPSV